MVYLKNIKGVQQVIRGRIINNGEYYLIPENERIDWSLDNNIFTLISDEDILIAKSDDGNNDIISKIEGWNYLGNLIPPIVDMQELYPFAKPVFRTKNDASNWITCQKNTNTNLDFQLTSEKYVSGGEIIFNNTEKGDYIEAHVVDVDGVIPAPYRASLCEAWPIVATYIIKRNIKPVGTNYDSLKIDTRPLNAKITSGLYLRITVITADIGLERNFCINYDLTKKL